MRAWVIASAMAFGAVPALAQAPLEGRYAGRGEGKLTATLKRAKGAPDRYEVVLRTQARNCGGDVSGRAVLEGGVLTLRAKTNEPKGCTVRMQAASGTLKVEEGEGCLSFHGVSCGFSGTLKRR